MDVPIKRERASRRRTVIAAEIGAVPEWFDAPFAAVGGGAVGGLEF